MSPKVRSTSRSCPQNSVCLTARPARPSEHWNGDVSAAEGHQAFSQWGPDTWAKWPHLVVRVGDNLTSPVNVAASAAGLGANDCGLGPAFFGDRAGPGAFRSHRHAAGDRDGGDPPSLSSGEQGSPISNRAASACDDLEHRPKQRSRYRVVARSIAAHHQKQICERTVRGAARRDPYPSRFERSTCEGAYFAADI